MDKTKVLNDLVRMSANLGRPENEYVILGEGNTSAKIDDETFYVKASGAWLCESSEDIFVEVRTAPVLDMCDGPDLTDAEIKERLGAARINPDGKWPSIETMFHAFLLSLPGVNFVGHTHPTAVNIILCSKSAEEILSARIFPDQVVYCGVRPLILPFTDPGVQLAKMIRRGVDDYIRSEGCLPKVILVRNHGLIAVGSTATEVEAITATWNKTCKILAGAYALGGIQPMSDENVARICTRPDEDYRREYLKK